MTSNDNKYLIYSIGGESYGSPLLTVREVLEYQKPKFMPNMASHFSGVINVRGAIVGIVDLRSKFSLSNDVNRKTAMLLCDTPNGPIAAVVDQVDCVAGFAENEIEVKPPVQPRMSQDYLLGVAKMKSNLVTLVDLNKLLSDENLKAA
jgi:purine-binding chemotaxis protein CheW